MDMLLTDPWLVMEGDRRLEGLLLQRGLLLDLGERRKTKQRELIST